MDKVDYLIVGGGLYGASCAYLCKEKGYKVIVIDKRPHLGGNLYCQNIEDINVHKYGAHIFHTSNKNVWDFVNRFVTFNRYTNAPIANYKGKLYNLPFNMNTFYTLWGVKTPLEAKSKLEEQKKMLNTVFPKNLEEQAINLVGRDIYEILIKEYTEKQWGRKCSELPAFIIKRLPIRFTFDNNYFNDDYQGIPIGGYNKLFDGLLEGIETYTGVDFFSDRHYWEKIANKIVFTGQIDEFYNYRFGRLEYRTVYFEEEILDIDNFQGNAVVNYTSADVPYTRIIEHKHFEFSKQPKTVISKEYSIEWDEGKEPYYPINDDKNNSLYLKYKSLADKEANVLFGGRLAEYKYYDMHQIIENVMSVYG